MGEDVREMFCELLEAGGVEEHLDDFLLGDCREEVAVGVVVLAAQEGLAAELVQEVEQQFHEFEFEDGLLRCLTALLDEGV